MIRELDRVWAIITLAVSAATSVITLGLSNVAGAGVAAAKAAHASSRIAKIVLKVARALEKLSDLLRKAQGRPAGPEDGAQVPRRLGRRQAGHQGGHGPHRSPLGTSASNLVTGLAGIAADEYDDEQRGGNGPQTPLRDAVDDPIRPLADHTRGISDRAAGRRRVPSPPGG